jgi:hypothetical protein
MINKTIKNQDILCFQELIVLSGGLGFILELKSAYRGPRRNIQFANFKEKK